MRITNRLTRVAYAEQAGLLAGDVTGRVHLLDEDLRPRLSSPAIRAGRPIHGLTVSGDRVTGTDAAGNAITWWLPTLDIAEVVAARPAGPDGAPGRHPTRRLRYDAAHDRFWSVEQDASTRPGLPVSVVLMTRDGVPEYELPFSRYALEFLEFSPDYSLAYAGGAEGVLHVIDNTGGKPVLDRTMSGFPHPLADLAVAPDGGLFVLTSSGELVLLDSDAECVQARAPVLRQSAWHLAAAAGGQGRLYCGTDDGVVVLDPQGPADAEPALSPTRRHDHGFGMVRRLATVPGGYLGLGRKEVVFRATDEGTLLWHTPIDDQGAGLAVSADHARALVATGVGAVELDAATGRPMAQLFLGGVPLSAAAYGPGGERVLGNYQREICAFAPDSDRELWWMSVGHVPEHLWSQDGSVYLCGGDGVRELDPRDGRVRRTWGGELGNVTAALVTAGMVHLACADGALRAYDRATGAPLGPVQQLPDLPRTLVRCGTGGGTHLVVGGRGGYLSVHPVSTAGVAAPLRETYLRRRGGRSFRLSSH